MARNLSKPNKPLWPFTLNSDCEQAQGLIGWYPGVSSGSPRLFDLSSSKTNHGSIGGTIPTSGVWSSGIGGGKGAVLFDGSTNFVDLGAVGTALTKGSFCGWVNFNDISAIRTVWGVGGTGALLWFVAFRLSTTLDAPPGAGNDILTVRSFDLSSGGVENNRIVGTTNLSQNKTYHVALVSDGSAYSIYINGISESLSVILGSNDGVFPGGLVQNGTPKATLGNLFATNSYNGQGMSGTIEDARLYNRALTPREVWSIYDQETRWSLRHQIGRSKYFVTKPSTVTAPRLKIIKGSDIYRIPISKFNATTAPGSSNDATQGYTPGSRWIDTTNKLAYTCVDHTAGAAVWVSG